MSQFQIPSLFRGRQLLTSFKAMICLFYDVGIDL